MDKFLTPKQAAEILLISEKTVTSWLRSGKLSGVKVGKYWRIMEQDLEEFLGQRRVGDRYMNAIKGKEIKPDSGVKVFDQTTQRWYIFEVTEGKTLTNEYGIPHDNGMTAEELAKANRREDDE